VDKIDTSRRPETEEQRRDRELAELRAEMRRHTQGMEIGLVGAILLIIGVIIWIWWHRPRPAPYTDHGPMVLPPISDVTGKSLSWDLEELLTNPL
jgi:hypothetical protein